MRPWIVLPLAMLACTSQPDDVDDTDGEPVDLRTEYEQPTDWTDPLIYASDDLVIPPYSDKLFCKFLTYDGPEVGIHAQRAWQRPYGHHFIIAGTTTSERDAPDGTTIDCTESDSGVMENLEPLLVGGTIDYARNVGLFELPEGFGARLAPGQRIILQSHYVNTSADPILVRDELQLDVLPAAEVGTWAAAWAFNSDRFSIPPGSDATESFSCTFEEDVNLLFVGGHMHEWGTAFSVDFTPAAGVDTSRIYEVTEWKPEYRDAPVYNNYAEGEFVVHAGDTFTTNCAWTNDTSGPLEFPHEMCTTFGMRYPARAPFICDAD